MRNLNPQPTMTTPSSCSLYLTAGTIRNCIVYDIDSISEGEGNGEESMTEPDTEPHDDKESDYGPENQLGLLENQCWGVRFLDLDGNEESNKQGEFLQLFSCKDGLGWWSSIGNVKYVDSGVQVDPVTNGSRSRIAVDFFPKSEETVSKIYLLTFLDLKKMALRAIFLLGST